MAATLSVASGAQAMDLSLGPALPPFGANNRPGPNGAQIFIAQDTRTFGLSGGGVRIGQFEPDEPRATHHALAGSVTLRGVGAANDDHATGVAGILIGRQFTPAGNPTIRGVAPFARLFSAGGDYFGGIGFLTGNNVRVLNMSAGFGTGGNNGGSAETLFADHIVRANDLVWVKSAGNAGTGAGTITRPGDAFNVITVGATGADAAGNPSEDYTRVANYSSRGPTGDGRHKPDLVAPGSRILMPSGTSNTAFQVDDGTSFAAPHVAGTAALLAEIDNRDGINRNHLSKKVAILNSASKHVRDPHMGDRAWPEFRAAAGSDVPLDNAMGVGQLNGMAAVRQYQPNDRSDVARFQATVAGNGTQTWSLFDNRPLKQGSLVTATITWDRHVVLPDGADPSVAGNYVVTPLRNLDLELVHRGSGAVVARSNSAVDNVEHIYFNVPTEGQYALRVRNGSAGAQSYAMAWTSGTSDGPAFSVDGGLFNPNRPAGTANPAEGLLAPYRVNPFPNDVHALGTAGPGNFPTEGEIFVSSLDGTNMERLSGALGTRSRVGPHNGPPAAMALLDTRQRGVFGLQPNDNIVGLSWGTDGTAGLPSVLLFSVDPFSSGAAGSDVHFQAVLSPPVGPAPVELLPHNPGGGDLFGGHEAAGDIFKSPAFDPFGAYPSALIDPARPRSNELFIDERQLGLQAPRARGSLLGPQEDDLDALEMDSPLLYEDPDGDGLHNRPAFFTLDRWSPSLGGGFSADDIFVSLFPFTFIIFADGMADIQLLFGDALDALVLSDVGAIGLLDRGLDEALFSLDPLSTSILALGANPADVYYTDFLRPWNPRLDWKLGGSLFASAAALGLLTTDNLNALDIMRATPEPASVVLVGLGVLGLVGYGWRRRRADGLVRDGAGAP